MANYRRGGVAIDVEGLTYSLGTLEAENLVMSPERCIFKTPNILSRHNEKAYVPNAFSIGPWHLGKPHLEATQKIKKKYLQDLICRRRSIYPREQLIGRLEDAIRRVANDACKCYAGQLCSTQDLVKILVLDGCFIIELFRKYNKGVSRDQDDPIFSMSCMLQFLHHDLVLLENQIPWFVLECLFDIIKIPEDSPLDLLAFNFFVYVVPPQYYASEEMLELLEHAKFRSDKSKHILDLLRNWLILSSEKKESNQTAESGENESIQCATTLREAGIKFKNFISKGIQKLDESNQHSVLVPEERKIKSYKFPGLPCATSLREAGIKFKKRTSKGILDIQFRNGVLEIPPLIVQESTETVFRNLISFEQCAPNYSPIITSYAKLMDDLIDNTKDMEILSEKNIIDSWLNVEDASQFFNKLYTDTYVEDFYYVDLCQQVNQYSQRKWPKWRAHLMHNYFNKPWAIVGLVVAGLILVLTIIGTVCSVIQAKYAMKQ